jgi:hypothetical protein
MRAEERFWAKVVKGPPVACWIWVGPIADDGYGRFYLHPGPGGMVRPHRYSYEIAHRIPLDAVGQGMHSCDVPLCVNPAHLHAGTHRDNMTDRARKGRHRNGTGLRFRGVPRAAFAARSRRLRAEVLAHGCVPHRVSAILAGNDPEFATLL